MKDYIHSVTLDKDKCRGCTNCIAHCPTEAIRVRKGKASIITERCIDCGECIRVCPHHAKKALSDRLQDLQQYDYTVAIPAPSLYGQFKDRFSINAILTALKHIGFDDVYEVAEAADIVTDQLRKLLNGKTVKTPYISSSCPAIVRLIQFKFPGLLDQIVKVESPMEIAARIVREDIHPDKKNLGVFFISPCPAKITAVRNPIASETSSVDRVIPISEIYLPLLNAAAEITEPEPLAGASFMGVGWANAEGESHSTEWPDTVAVDGIANVMKFFEELENGKIQHVDFIEAMACPGGCVGGALTVENPYISKARIIRKVKKLETSTNRGSLPVGSTVSCTFEADIPAKQDLPLDSDFRKAVEKIARMEELLQSLPGLDCGSCGAPTCRALAEDIVRGTAKKNDCIFVLRDEIRALTSSLAELGSWMPPAMAEKDKSDEQTN